MVLTHPKHGGLFYGWWIVVASLVILLLFSGAGYYSFSIFIPPLEREFGWSRAAIALTMSIHMVSAGLAAPAMGRLVQAFGPRRVMTWGALGSGALFILVSQTRSLVYFYAVYGLLALCLSGTGMLPVSCLLARWFERRRGTAIGAAMVGISLGGLLLAPLIGLTTLHFSWRVSFVVLGLMIWAVGLPLVQAVIRDWPADMGLCPDGERMAPERANPPVLPGAVADSEKGEWTLGTAVRGGTFWWIAVTWFLAATAQSGILQHQVPIFMGVGLSEAVAATALGLTAGFGGFGKVGFGRLSELLPFRCAAMLCFGLQGGGALILLLAKGTAWVWVYVLLFGVSMGGLVVLLPLAVGHFFGLRAFPVILGVLGMSQAMGNAVGAFVSGLIHDHTGSYDAAIIAYAAIYALSVITMFLAGKTQPYRG
jgi:sugar phosphate permease